MNSIEEKLDIARKDLLDLSLRNTLINYRPLKSRGVEVIDGSPEEVFSLLVSEGKVAHFLPKADDQTKGHQTGKSRTEENALSQQAEVDAKNIEEQEASREDLLTQSTENSDANNGITNHSVNQFLQTPHSVAELQKRLLNTFYTARTYIEEQGVNVLFLALGMLQWYESPGSDISRQAPLILIPVELSRANVRSQFDVRYTGDDIGENLSLRTKLKTDFNIELPELVDDEEMDISAYYDSITRVINNYPQWGVNRTAVALGFFSFGTFLMYRDLDLTNWPDSTHPTKHSVLKSLLQDGFHESPPALDTEDLIDDHVSPVNSYQVVDADSSQTLAILDVKQGRNLVIQGPPGTGKSQTITNLIAEALGQNKTVLFVAEKMAALEVVKRRLDAVGLGDACLEIHSHKTNKKVFLGELQRTQELGKPKINSGAADSQDLLIEDRDSLNAYSRAVNTPVGQTGVTPYTAYGELLRLEGQLGDVATPAINEPVMLDWSEADFRRWLGRIKEMQTHLVSMGIPSQHPFWGTRRHQLIFPVEKREALQSCEATKRAIQQLRDLSEQLAVQLNAPTPETRKDVISLSQAAQWILQAPTLAGVDIMATEWLAQAGDIEAALKLGEQISELRHQYDDWLLPEAWTQEILPVRQAYVVYGHKWWRLLSRDFRQARNKLVGLCRQKLPETIETQQQMIDAILEVQRLQPLLEQHTGLLSRILGANWLELASDWKHLTEINTWLLFLHKQIEGGRFPAGLLDYLKSSRDHNLRTLDTSVEDALEEHHTALNGLVKQIELDETLRLGEGSTLLSQRLPLQQHIVEEWGASIERLDEMAIFNHTAIEIREAGLREIVDIASTWLEAPRHLTSIFKRLWYEMVITTARKDRPILGTFNARTHSWRIQRFCDADKRSFQVNQTKLADQHWQRLPLYMPNGGWGILLREFQKRSRHLPIRKLMEKAGHAIQVLKPVFMMSPLSVAMFLPPGTVPFDLVIFDEASQIRPVEAFGAIIRAGQAIVVGDSRQLPPTSFFNQFVEADDEVESPTADLESILGLFLAQGAPQRMLRWHYRSRHESLITVSNHEFYDNKLVIFPSPDAEMKDVGVKFHYSREAVYDRGKSRANQKQARLVAEAVMEHARTRPDLSLGVAAFSISQTLAIQDHLEILRRQATDSVSEHFFDSHPFEPFFVKNLENVQGDERDVIFISVGYGRAASGQLSMNFGPLNRQGGERRLNVLITRARRRCEVFSSLFADDIDLEKTNARGIIALKRYLNFLQTGSLDIPLPGNGEPDSPFEWEVAKALRGQGYEIVSQVGSAGYRIDLAVKDMDSPGRYLLGIECDGATYHSARSARDRDRLRQAVLEGMGWQIHRIWSTDWFRNPQQELQRTIKAIEAARSKPPLVDPQSVATSPSRMHSNSPPIERHDSAPLVSALEAQDYQVAHPIIETTQALHEVPQRQLAVWIWQVVEIESPVHADEVTRRIIGAAGLKRTGKRINAAIQKAIRHAHMKGMIRKKGDFLWSSKMEVVRQVRSHANVSEVNRSLERIAPEEIMLAVELVVKSSLGMQRENIPSSVCTLFGFGRTSREMGQQIDILIDQMLVAETLKERGNSLIVEKT